MYISTYYIYKKKNKNENKMPLQGQNISYFITVPSITRKNLNIFKQKKF